MIAGCLGDPMLRQSPYSLGWLHGLSHPCPIADSPRAIGRPPSVLACVQDVVVFQPVPVTGAVETGLDAKQPDVRIF